MSAILTAEPWLVVDDADTTTAAAAASTEGGGKLVAEAAAAAVAPPRSNELLYRSTGAGCGSGGGGGGGDAGCGGGGGRVRLCKILHNGKLHWARLDPTLPTCYEWLCRELQLHDAAFVVQSAAAYASSSFTSENCIRSSPALADALTSVREDEVLVLDVVLDPGQRASLLAQSFVVLDHALLDGSLNRSSGAAGNNPSASSDTATVSATPPAADTECQTHPEDDQPLFFSAAGPSYSSEVIAAWFDIVFRDAPVSLDPDALKASYEALATAAPQKFDGQINLDVPRTFAKTQQQQQELQDTKVAEAQGEAEGQRRLRRVLRAISQRLDAGYVQGMNFICAFLLQSPSLGDGTRCGCRENECFALVVGLLELRPKYDLGGLFALQMPKLKTLIYQVDHLLPRVAPRLAHHLATIGISSSLLFVPGWALTLFTNKLPAHQAMPLFELIVRDGFSALVRLCLAALVAFEEQLCACDFELCLVQLQQHMWQDHTAGRRVVDALESFRVSDADIARKALEYASEMRGVQPRPPQGAVLAAEAEAAAKVAAGAASRPGLQKAKLLADKKSARAKDMVTAAAAAREPSLASTAIISGAGLAIGGVVTAAIVGMGAFLYANSRVPPELEKPATSKTSK